MTFEISIYLNTHTYSQYLTYINPARLEDHVRCRDRLDPMQAWGRSSLRLPYRNLRPSAWCACKFTLATQTRGIDLYLTFGLSTRIQHEHTRLDGTRLGSPAVSSSEAPDCLISQSQALRWLEILPTSLTSFWVYLTVWQVEVDCILQRRISINVGESKLEEAFVQLKNESVGHF